jgi:hypothetical protein
MIHGQRVSWWGLLINLPVGPRGARNASSLTPAARGLNIQFHHAKVSRGVIERCWGGRMDDASPGGELVGPAGPAGWGKEASRERRGWISP